MFRALPQLRSAANDLPYTSKVALGISGKSNAQAGKVAHSFVQRNFVESAQNLTPEKYWGGCNA